jgi:hypothetical protein
MKADGKESRAEVFMMALESLSKAEKRLVASRLLDYPYLREDVLDIALVLERDEEPSFPIEDVLAGRTEISATG